MNKIAIITCYNDEFLFKQMSDSIFSRGGGNVDCCQIIGIDNRNRSFPSAAAAYNHVLNLKPEADVFVFCHQDIVFLEGSIDAIIEHCSQNPRSLFGAAGVKKKSTGNKSDRVISSMAMLQEGWNYTSLSPGTVESVFTLDECLIAASSDLFCTLSFDESVCDGWHLYAAELCLYCQTHNIPVQVFDSNIIHLSGGTPDKSFYDCERKLVRKYKHAFPIISYSWGWAYTNPFKYHLQRFYRKIRYGL